MLRLWSLFSEDTRNMIPTSAIRISSRGVRVDGVCATVFNFAGSLRGVVGVDRLSKADSRA
jgi:hypothetical protein